MWHAAVGLALVVTAVTGAPSHSDNQQQVRRLAIRAQLTNCHDARTDIMPAAGSIDCFEHRRGVVRIASFSHRRDRAPWVQYYGKGHWLVLGPRWAVAVESPVIAKVIGRRLHGKVHRGPAEPFRVGAASSERSESMGVLGWLLLLVPLGAFLATMGWAISRSRHSARVSRIGRV